MNIINASTEMRSKPFDNSLLETECLFGEKVEVLDQYNEWIYCKLLIDNYCGWVKKEDLGELKPPTHRVFSKRSFLLSNKKVKSQCIHHLPIGAKLHVQNIEKNWVKINLSTKHNFRVGFVPALDIVKIDHKLSDWISVAEKLIGTPYKWGGRNSMGLDCSALIQLAYETYGQNIPRNSIDQMKLQKKVINKNHALKRGYVIFWEGHVGVMVNNLNCIHANAYHMRTVIEPLDDIIIRMGGKNKIIKIMDFNK